ncbi:MAG: PocR ligand-binding domain-containing protein [Candidatus Omnitrophica bacterium]|nr:PocR ligand-binding domain-containing protein [Candidatus Omnitrophota bacterium]
MFQKDLEVDDLVNLEYWQTVQDLFADAFEITLRTITAEGSLLSKTSRPLRLCETIHSKTSAPSDFCGRCALAKNTKSLTELREVTNAECAFDLDVFIVPIKAIGSKIFAYVIVGPVSLKDRKIPAQYAKEAASLGVNAEELLDALIEINVFSYSKIYSITRLIESVFSNMAQSGYHKKRLGEIAPEIAEMDPLFMRYYEEKILNALLKSCTIALDADSGSVMTVDKKTGTLSIKVSSKIEEGIKNDTQIKMGEGIAGLAASTSQPIILPKDKDKTGLYGKLNRKYIKSSMIIPFEKGNTHEVYGVINLNMVRKDRDFSEKDIAIARELISMASAALSALQ